MTLPDGRGISLIDLPGIYSLNPRSEDEQVAHDVLKGLRRDTPRPEAVLLILDSTNLARQLMLAAPVLSLGVPTLVVLNMADDLRARGGELDTSALSPAAWRPGGAGQRAAGRRPRPGLRVPGRRCAKAPRRWNFRCSRTCPSAARGPAQVGHRASYQAPAPPKWTRRLDAVFLHPVAGPLVFALVVMAVFQTIFTAATPLMDGCEGLLMIWSGELGRRRVAGIGPAVAAGGRRVGRGGIGAGVPAADPAVVPVHRGAGGLRLPGARGADCGPHHGARGPAGKVVHSAAFGLRLRGAGGAWPRAPSRTSATASPRF